MKLDEQLKALAELRDSTEIRIRYASKLDMRMTPEGAPIELWALDGGEQTKVGEGSTLSLALAHAFAKLAGEAQSAVNQLESELASATALKSQIFKLSHTGSRE